MRKGDARTRTESGSYCQSRKYMRASSPTWFRCPDCGARILPPDNKYFSPSMHDGDCVFRSKPQAIVKAVRKSKAVRTEICEQCNGPVSLNARGRPNTYCSPACRQRAYRQRQKSNSVR